MNAYIYRGVLTTTIFTLFLNLVLTEILMSDCSAETRTGSGFHRVQEATIPELIAYPIPQDGFRGDINHDGPVNVVDVIFVTRFLLGLEEFTPEEFWLADCNGDEGINIRDALGINNVILEIGIYHQGSVGGVITIDMTWTAEGSPYTAIDNIIVSCGNNTRFEYCVFEKYRRGEFVIECDNSSPTFSHCTLPGFTPQIETGGGIIGCMNTFSPRIEFSKPTMRGYHTACVACTNPPDFNNPEPSNPRLFENDFYIGGLAGYAVVGSGFLNGNYLHIMTVEGRIEIDTSLGTPVDEIGDGVFSTTLISCIHVDGITNPRAMPHFSTH